jgi:hypothetical protein
VKATTSEREKRLPELRKQLEQLAAVRKEAQQLLQTAPASAQAPVGAGAG